MKTMTLLASLALALAACNPYLSQQSVAPPGRTARLDEVKGFWGLKSYTIEVTQGIALALSCELGAPCNRMVATSDDRAIADVRIGSFGGAGLVVVGLHPGTTHVHVRAKEGQRDISVTVIAPPVYGDPTTRVAAGP